MQHHSDHGSNIYCDDSFMDVVHTIILQVPWKGVHTTDTDCDMDSVNTRMLDAYISSAKFLRKYIPYYISTSGDSSNVVYIYITSCYVMLFYVM